MKGSVGGRRTRGRRIATRAALVLVSLVVVLVAVEILLRLWPTLLGPSFANGALSRYTSRAGGIFYYDRALRMNFMIPNHSATMYYNGYVWRHGTDALGFRNETLHVPADVLLLGDSVVYGHGVDFEHTLGHQLERRTGLRVVNLGRQGDCAFQQAYLLSAFRPLFTPRVVVHVFSPNDIEDLYVYLSEAAIRAFVAQPLDAIAFPPRTDPATLLAEPAARRARAAGWPPTHRRARPVQETPLPAPGTSCSADRGGRIDRRTAEREDRAWTTTSISGPPAGASGTARTRASRGRVTASPSR